MANHDKDIGSKAVDEAYLHYEKSIVSHELVNLNSNRMKWYDIAHKDLPIIPSFRNAALKFLEIQAASNGVPNKNELGFILLHRCGEDFYFLMLCTWRDSNELWKTVFYCDTQKMKSFAVFPQDEQHKGTFCVWEMNVVSHESFAWTKFLLSNRNQKDEDLYLLSKPNAVDQ